MSELTYKHRQLLEKKAILKRELANRKAGDPLREFDLFHPQRPFAQSIIREECKESYYIGANRSGKSDAGAFVGAYLARFGYGGRGEPTSGWVSAVDFPTSRDTIQPKYFDNGFVPPGATHEPFIPDREIKEWRVSDQILKLKNGSIIGFKSADSGRKKYQGAEKDWIHFDEEHPKEIYDEAIIRVGANPLRIFTTCTLLPPEGQVGGVTWIYSDIVEPWKAGILENAKVFNASIYDNPHIPRAEISFLESKYPEGGTPRKIRLEGQLIPGMSGARIYAGFNHQLNIASLPDVNIKRPLCWIWDFNVEPMMSLVGQKVGKTFYVYKELVLEEGSIHDMCEYFKREFPYHRAPIWVYGDATGKHRSHQTNKSSYQLIINEMDNYPVPITLKVPESNPSVPDRINSVNVACSDPQGMVNLYVDQSCKELIRDMDQVVSDGKGGIKKVTNKKDPYYARTHYSDGLGYWVFAEAPIVPMNFDEQRVSHAAIPRPGYKASSAHNSGAA